MPIKQADTVAPHALWPVVGPLVFIFRPCFFVVLERSIRLPHSFYQDHIITHIYSYGLLYRIYPETREDQTSFPQTSLSKGLWSFFPQITHFFHIFQNDKPYGKSPAPPLRRGLRLDPDADSLRHSVNHTHFQDRAHRLDRRGSEARPLLLVSSRRLGLLLASPHAHLTTTSPPPHHPLTPCTRGRACPQARPPPWRPHQHPHRGGPAGCPRTTSSKVKVSESIESQACSVLAA